MNIDVRKYIINNFKDDDVSGLRNAIESSIASKDEDPLIGMGVLLELLWNNSDEELKNKIIDNIYKGMH